MSPHSFLTNALGKVALYSWKKKKKSIPIRIDFPFLFTSSPSISFCLQYTDYPFLGTGAWEIIKKRGSHCPYIDFFFLSFQFPLVLDCSGEFLLSYLSSWTRAPLCILTCKFCINGSPDDEAVCSGLLQSLQTSARTLASQTPLEAWPTTLCISYLCTLSQTLMFQCQHLILHRQPRTTQTLILSKGYSLIPWAAYRKFHPILFKTIILVLLTITKFIVLYGCVIHHQQKVNELGFQF